jgi:hypothetical protein
VTDAGLVYGLTRGANSADRAETAREPNYKQAAIRIEAT